MPSAVSIVMTDRVLAVLLTWPNGRQLVVTLDQLTEMSRRRLGAATVKLVSWHLPTGQLLEPGEESVTKRRK